MKLCIARLLVNCQSEVEDIQTDRGLRIAAWMLGSVQVMLTIAIANSNRVSNSPPTSSPLSRSPVVSPGMPAPSRSLPLLPVALSVFFVCVSSHSSLQELRSFQPLRLLRSRRILHSLPRAPSRTNRTHRSTRLYNISPTIPPPLEILAGTDTDHPLSAPKQTASAATASRTTSPTASSSASSPPSSSAVLPFPAPSSSASLCP